MKSMAALPLLLLFFLLSVVHGSSSCNFSYSYFQKENTPNLSLSNDARLSRGAAQVSLDSLNPNTPSTSWGWVVDSRPLQFKPANRDHNKDSSSASFNTTFHLNLQVNNSNSGVGGGMAFILTPYPEETNKGSNRFGKWLGIYNETVNGLQSNNIVAVEFDTYQDAFDSDNNHIGLDLNNISSVQAQPLHQYGMNLSDSNVNFTVWIDYDGTGKTLDVFMSKAGVNAALEKSKAKNVLSVTDIDLGKYTSDVVYAGFAGSSGDAIDLHCLFSWEFSMNCFPTDSTDNSFSRKSLFIGLVTTISTALIGIIFLLLIRRRKYHKQRVTDPRLIKMAAESVGPRKFSYKELSKATGNFSRDNKLGSGASGMVYKAILHDKTVVAVKRISCEGVTEFVAEVSSISKLRHRNVLHLIGWSFSQDCDSKDELLLVYQYMPKGSLDRWLFRPTFNGQPCRGTLDWGQRYKVLCGTAAALIYLHEGWEQTVIHRDVKASNIMLDSDFTPRLGDFGLARIAEHGLSELPTIHPAGTPGYIPPELLDTRMVSKEADVYSFGIVVLEVVCGRRPVFQDKEEQSKLLLEWVWELYLEGKLLEAVDNRLAPGSYEVDDLERILKVGLFCANPNMKDRPCMSVVLQELTSKSPSSFQLPSSRPRYNRRTLLPASSFPLLISPLDGHLTSPPSSCTSVAQEDPISLVLPR